MISSTKPANVKLKGAQKFVLDASNFVSRWTMLWVLKLIVKSLMTSPESLVFKLNSYQTAAINFDQLFDAMENGSVSLQKALLRAFGLPYAVLGFWKLIWAGCTWTAAFYLLKAMMEGPSHLLAFLLLGLAAFAAIAIQRLYAGSYTVRCQVRNSLTSVVFKKSLVLGSSHVQVGSIVNMVSTDVEAISDCVSHFHFLWSGCVEVVAVLALAFFLAGWNSAMSVLVVVLTVPLQLYIGYLISKASSTWIKSSGDRLHLMTEILTAVKLIKFYTWEKHFIDKLGDVRQKEADAAARQIWLRAINFGLVMGAPVIATLTCLLTMQLAGVRLDPVVAFTLVSLFNTLRYPLFMMPIAVKSLASSQSAMRSLNNFLRLPEIEDQRQFFDDEANCTLNIKNAALSWGSNDAVNLNSINLTLEKGQVMAIVGDVGTGKSSILAAILGQMNIVSGEIACSKRISYCPQEAWLLNQTVRDNIVFGSEYDAVRYKKVTEVCQLIADFAKFSGGDMMQIAERGANLSGGQKQRVSLARAVYNESNMVLLDDPLSALDQHVGRNVFEQCIKGYMSDRAVVIVTHQLQYLPSCDYVVIMGGDGIKEAGSFTALAQKTGGHLRSLMTSHTDIDLEGLENEGDLEADHIELPPGDGDDRTILAGNGALERVTISSTTEIEMTPQPSFQHESMLEENQRTLKEVSLLNSSHTINAAVLARKAELDHRSQCAPYYAHTLGSNAFSRTLQINEIAHLTRTPKVSASQDNVTPGSKPRNAFAEYIGLGGATLSAWSIIILFFLVHGVRIAGDIWIKVWQGGAGEALNRAFSLGRNWDAAVFCFLGCLFVIGVLMRGHLLARTTERRANQLHDDMASALFKAPMEFYDRTPLGTILQNSSKHQSDADDRLPDAALQLLTYMPLAVGAFAIIIWQSPSPIIVALLLFSSVGACILLTMFPRWAGILAYSQERDSVAKPKLFSHIAASLEGLFSIRAFTAQERFFDELLSHLDEVTIWQTVQQSIRFFVALYIDVICGFAVYCCAVMFVFYPAASNAAMIGLALSSALQLVVFVQWTLRMVEEAKLSVTSVASLRSFGDGSIPAEAQPAMDTEQLDSDWPQSGFVTFKDVVLRYTRYGVAVLKQVNFVVKPREKIGIVGRTGSGKSTLLIALLRIVEPCGGRILIDGVDVARISLRDLRKRIAIIPQEPVVFAGTIRSNLDPYGEFSDDDMWHALSAVELTDHIRLMGSSESGAGLDAVCVENGSNFSLGQRQLFCIARAILTKSKVVVLDEATAAIDASTDAIVQKAFEENFADCTVLTIAHRLNTIIESDKILFMDQGRVAEFDRPSTLLNDENSAFYGLVAQTGPDSARKLTQMAQSKFARQQSEELFDNNDDTAFLDALARPVDPHL
uniref:Uncharacterized protein n=2 Tax=Spongospora subterranea TaxID=70186 RepID=A0A0H5RPN9_9EUKA|eukprot:CRZ10689.1 hypothetical protein [Spongospora subterranea]